jgi:hypothetical protein
MKYSDEGRRTLGHTYAFPPISHSPDPASGDSDTITGFTEDWCLIETQVPRDTVSRNLFNLLDGNERMKAWGHEDLFPPLDVRYDDHMGFLPVEGMLTSSKLGEHSLAVLKRGASSGLTLGVTNPLVSYVRYGKVWSLEQGVLGLKRSFSDTGDSGALVMDRRGRACGILTAGNGGEVAVLKERAWGTEAVIDISYVTPMWWVLERMRIFG